MALALQRLIHNPTTHAAVYPAPMPVHSAGHPPRPPVRPPVHSASNPPAVSVIGLSIVLQRVVWVDGLGQLDLLALCYFFIEGNIVRFILDACIRSSLGFSHAQCHGSCDTDT